MSERMVADALKLPPEWHAVQVFPPSPGEPDLPSATPPAFDINISADTGINSNNNLKM